jgi:hypothetical protein
MRMPTIPLDPLGITPDWLSEVLNSDVRVCKIEQIGIGYGLLGRLFRVHLDGAPDLPRTVVVKLPTLDVTARVNLCEAAEFYLREIRFYQEIGVKNPLRPAQPYFAAFDEATHDFVLVLEDLGGSATPTRSSGAACRTPRRSSTASPATTPTGGTTTASRRFHG